MADAKFVEGSVFRHISVMTATAATGLMALFVVDLIDLYFLSLLGETELAAAVGYAGSILFFTTSVCIGLAIAMAALVARAIGANQEHRAKRYVAHVSLFSVAVTVPIALAVWFAVPFFLSSLGAQGRTHELASLYLSIIIPTMPILAVAIGLGGALRAVGAARLAMMSTLVGGAVNAVLDPILIFGLDLGIAGAALASVGARIAVFLVAAYGVVFKSRIMGSVKLSALLRDTRRIVEIAAPAILTNVATPFGNAYVVTSMAKFGDDVVAGYSIVGRIIPVAFGIVFALSGAVGPVIGQNLGAKKFDRIRRALLDALLLSTGVVLFAAVLLFVFKDAITGAFGASDGATSLFNFFATFVAVFFVFNGAQFIANAAFNNLGHPLWSTYSNWGRVTFGTIPFVWIGAHFMGANGVLLGQAVGGALFGIVTFIVAWRLSAGTGEKTRPPKTQSRMFHIPLSAQTVYRGWMGLSEDSETKK